VLDSFIFAPRVKLKIFSLICFATAATLSYADKRPCSLRLSNRLLITIEAMERQEWEDARSELADLKHELQWTRFGLQQLQTSRIFRQSQVHRIVQHERLIEKLESEIVELEIYLRSLEGSVR
jgi:hypothetical protein